VTREHSRTILHLSRDDRLIAAVGGAVAHFAERVGMENSACNQLTAALEELCRQTLPLLNGNGDGLDVAIEDFEDRLQISVEHKGEAQPSVGVESFIAECARDSDKRLTGVRLMRTVDRIEYDARSGNIRTTLVKYLQFGQNEFGKNGR
jgi:anti-sigma regulatory factor (Ser/Thr protein kinase)